MFTLKVDAQLPEDRPFRPIERLIPVQVIAPAARPLPTQTGSTFVLPTPDPRRAPNWDGMGTTI